MTETSDAIARYMLDNIDNLLYGKNKSSRKYLLKSLGTKHIQQLGLTLPEKLDESQRRLQAIARLAELSLEDPEAAKVKRPTFFDKPN